MARELRMIDQIQVAKPCPASWDEMKGDNAVRHCSLCRLDVYNFSEMTEREIELLLAKGGVCGKLYRREDGTILTKDCPRGVRALRARVVRRVALAASFVLSAVGCGERGEAVKHAMGVDVVENAFQKPDIVQGEFTGFVVDCPPYKPPPSTGEKRKAK